jgi:broad specificity phosphatase PhoE
VDGSLWLLRHGESAWNAEGRLQGRLAVPLNGRGRSQAVAAAAFLASLPRSPVAVYSSPLLRARQSAVLVARALGRGVRIEPGLRERHMGALEGLTWEEVARRWGLPWPPATWIDIESGPGVEPVRSLGARAVATADRLAALHPGETVLAVTHGSWLGAFLDAVGAAPWGTRLPNNGELFRAVGGAGVAWRVLASQGPSAG